MAISIKSKIRIGTLFLFCLLILSGGVSIYYLLKLKADAKEILKNNYESLEYCHNMQKQLDSIQFHYPLAQEKFDSYLKRQEKNITENGEKEITGNVRKSFDAVIKGDTNGLNFNDIKNNIQRILALNMKGIEKKNRLAQESSESASTILVLIVGLTIIIGLTFSYNFPAIVVTPIKKLTEAIKEISAKNYKYRIHLENKDEFGQLANAFNDMTERLQEFENSNLNKLIFEKARAEAVINSLKDASIGIDKNNVVLFANSQALQLLGIKSEDIVGKQVGELTSKNDLFKFLIENDAATPFKIVLDNRENYFAKEVMEINQGDLKNKVIVVKNITSFKELDVAKTNFISTISHELKTPLASSDFSLRLLEDERVSKLSQEQKELISNLKEDNRRMLKILSELLNMSQVEAGRIQLNIQKVDPLQVIHNAIQSVTGNAKEKEIKIINTSAKELPPIDADADKTTWILTNFLTNAIKYSYANSSIEVQACALDHQIIFSVKDFGAGINKEYLHRLFERYFQVPGSSEKGSGLGLAISKEFVEAQQGKIWVESEIGKGSVFNFQLPVK